MSPSFTFIVLLLFGCFLSAASLRIQHDLRDHPTPLKRTPAAPFDTPTPRAHITVPTRNLDVVAKGDVISGFVTVANTGTTPLHLYAFSSGCQSPQFRKYREVIPPGSTEFLAIQIRVSEPGTHLAQAQVLTDDPENAILSINYTYTVEKNNE